MSDALAAYLARIGVPDATTPDLPTLARIVLGHTTSIPFENLDPFTGAEPPVDADGLTAKLVHGGRGGWCFEQNNLLRNALDALGYRTRGLAGRVMWGRPADAPPLPRGHMLLRVDGLDGGPHLVDVGFGGLSLTGVLRLAPDVEQETPHEPFRVATAQGGYHMQVRVGDEWRSQYLFDEAEQLLPDYAVSSWYLAHHPDSHFRHGLMCARPDPDRRYALNNTTLSVHHLGGPSEKRELSTVAEVHDVLERHFHLDLSGVTGLDTRLEQLLAG